MLKSKKKVTEYLVKEFSKIYKEKDENVNYRKELEDSLTKLRKTRQKYMDMYMDDLISREELNKRIGGTKKEIERLENDLKLVEHNLDKGSQLENIIQKTFKNMEDITSVRDMTNEQLKQIIQKIEVDKEGNIDIYMRVLGDLGLSKNVLISDSCTYRSNKIERLIWRIK